MRPLFDAHLDLAWNALHWNRDLTQSLADMRAAEAHMTDHRARGRATVTLPELRRARVGVCLGTVLVRAKPNVCPAGGFNRRDLDFRTQTQACAVARGQLAYYELLERQGHVRIVRTRDDLAKHWAAWSAAPAPAAAANGMNATADNAANEANTPNASNAPKSATAGSATNAPTDTSGSNAADPTGNAPPLGVIIAMEGADPIVEPAQAAEWFDAGLRCVGLAHYGPSRYAVGTGAAGPLTDAGRALLKEFEQLGMIVDLTHCSEPGFFEVLDVFGGKVHASHNMCRALVPADRQFSDEQIKGLVERDAVIGMALDAWMLYRGWVIGQTSPDVVSIAAVADHIDHVCQIAGSARHVGIGSDLDGGFGTEQTPHDLNSIDDLHRLEDLLAARGYGGADIDGIFFQNWLRFFTDALPILPRHFDTKEETHR